MVSLAGTKQGLLLDREPGGRAPLGIAGMSAGHYRNPIHEVQMQEVTGVPANPSEVKAVAMTARQDGDAEVPVSSVPWP